MDIDKYIKWDEIWINEVDLSEDGLLSDEAKEALKQLKGDSAVSMVIEECNLQILDGDEQELIFQFSETGGRNESDTQGWSRDYWITLDENYLLKNVDYEQG
jgi:hypothetical protein